MYWGVFTVIIIPWTHAKVCTNLTKSMTRFWLFCISENKIKKTASNAVFLGEGIFTMGYSKNYIMYWGVFTVIIIPWTHAKVCTNLTKSMTRFWLFCISENKIKKTASNAVFLGEGIFTMGYSKNYIMYWGVFTVIIIPWTAG